MNWSDPKVLVRLDTLPSVILVGVTPVSLEVLPLDEAAPHAPANKLPLDTPWAFLLCPAPCPVLVVCPWVPALPVVPPWLCGPPLDAVVGPPLGPALGFTPG